MLANFLQRCKQLYKNSFQSFEIEQTILSEAVSFLSSYCFQFNTTKTISNSDIESPRRGSLGKARNTKDKDECSYWSSGIQYSPSGIPTLSVSFKTWQGGGQIFKWSSYETVGRLLKEKGVDDASPSPAPTPPIPSFLPPSPSQDFQGFQGRPILTARELTPKQKMAFIASSYSSLKTSGSSGYLSNKCFSNNELCLLPDARFGLSNNGNFLAIPCYSSFEDYENRVVCGVQSLFDDGAKRFIKNSLMSGSFYVIGDIKNPSKIGICEGLATGLSIHLASRIPVIVSFNAGNLEPVAKEARERFPETEITICADNDQWKAEELNQNTGKKKGNTGILKGIVAAKACGGKLVYPIFNGLDCSSRPTDFNDLYQLAGIDEVKNQLEENPHFDELIKQLHINYPHRPEGINAAKLLPKQIVDEEIKKLTRLPELNIGKFSGEIFDLNQYVNPFTFTTTDKKTVYYASNMGTGKTTAIEAAVKEALNKGFTVCSIAHRVSLVRTLATRLGVNFYREGGTVNINGENLAICVDSIHKLKDKSYDIVFIDEIEQVVRQIISKRDNRSKIFEEFIRLISQAQILVVADAHLSDLTLGLIQERRAGIPAEFHKSRYELGAGRTCYMWASQNSIIDDMLMNLRNNSRIVVATDSREESNRLFNRFQQDFPEKRGIVVNNDTRENEEVKNFIANINNEINKLDYILYSPTISSGISIDAIETYKPFTAHYGIFSPQSGPSARDAWQQILRFRAKFDVNVYINPRTENKPVTIKELIKDLRTKASCDLLSRSGAEKIREFFQNIPNTNEFFPEDNLKRDGLYFLELQATVDRNKQLNNFKQAFGLQAILDGWTIQHIDTKSENKNARNNKELSDKARVKDICSAQDIGPTRAENLKNKQSLTSEEKNSLHKYELKEFYKTDVDVQLVQSDQNGEQRKCIQRIEHIFNQELALDIDLEFLKQYATNSDDTPLGRYKGEKLKAEINQIFMEKAGFSLQECEEDGRSFLKICHDGRTLSKENFDSSFIEENAEKIRAAYTLRRDFKHNPLQTVFDSLRRLGLKFTYKRCSKGRSGIYNCDVSKMESLNRFLKIRGLPDVNPTLELGVSPPDNIVYKQLSAQLTHNKMWIAASQ